VAQEPAPRPLPAEKAPRPRAKRQPRATRETAPAKSYVERISGQTFNHSGILTDEDIAAYKQAMLAKKDKGRG